MEMGRFCVATTIHCFASAGIKMCLYKTIAHWTDMKKCYQKVIALLPKWAVLDRNEHVFA